MSSQGVSDNLNGSMAGFGHHKPVKAPKTGRAARRPASAKTIAIIGSLVVHGLAALAFMSTQFNMPAPEVSVTEAILVSMGPLNLPQPEPSPAPPQPPAEVKPLIQPRPTPTPLIAQVPPLPLSPVKPEPVARPVSDAPPEVQKAPPAPAKSESDAFVAVDVDYALTSNPPPAYPPQAKARHEQGTVHLRLQVRPDGSVGEIQVKRSSGSQRLDRAAVDAVSRWRFKPATQGGKPVESWTNVPITFGFKKSKHRDRRKGGQRDEVTPLEGDAP